MLARYNDLRSLYRHNLTGQRPVGLCSRTYEGPFMGLHRSVLYILFWRGLRPLGSDILDPTDPGCPHDGATTWLLEHSPSGLRPLGLCRYKWPTATYTSTTLRSYRPSLLLLFYWTIEVHVAKGHMYRHDLMGRRPIRSCSRHMMAQRAIICRYKAFRWPFMAIWKPYLGLFLLGSGCPKGSPHIVQYLKYGMWPKATCLLYLLLTSPSGQRPLGLVKSRWYYFLILLTKLLLRSNSLAKWGSSTSLFWGRPPLATGPEIGFRDS